MFPGMAARSAEKSGVKVRAAWLMAGLLAIGLVACVSHEIRPLNPQPIEAYGLRETSGDVTVAAESLTTKEKAEAAFSIDLTERGYAPILLLMENQSGDAILLLRDQIELVDGQGNLHRPMPACAVVEKIEANQGIISSIFAKEAREKRRSDWSNKELPAEKTLMPNQQHHGVLYFELGPGLPALPKAALYVPFKNLRTGERHAVFLRMKAAAGP